jgi:hypothetical protein
MTATLPLLVISEYNTDDIEEVFGQTAISLDAASRERHGFEIPR